MTNGVPELTERGANRRRARQAAEPAIHMLLRRAGQMEQRALRAAQGSNERQKYTTRAQHIRACALILSRNEDFQESLHKRGLLTRGWRVLAESILDLHRKAAA